MIKELLPQALGHTIARACTVLWSLSDSLEHEKILYLEKTDEQIPYLEKTNVIDSQKFSNLPSLFVRAPLWKLFHASCKLFSFLKK